MTEQMDRLVDLQDQVEHLRELLADAIGDRDRARTIAVTLEQENALLTAEIDRYLHEFQPGTDPETCGAIVTDEGDYFDTCPCREPRLADVHRTARRIVEQHQELRDSGEPF